MVYGPYPDCYGIESILYTRRKYTSSKRRGEVRKRNKTCMTKVKVETRNFFSPSSTSMKGFKQSTRKHFPSLRMKWLLQFSEDIYGVENDRKKILQILRQV